MWENFVIAEKLKYHLFTRDYGNYYFRRTYDKQEIDLINEKDGILHGWEIKRKHKKNRRIPKIFLDTYPDAQIMQISKENIRDIFDT